MPEPTSLETSSNGSIAPNIDIELDAALSKSFAGNMRPSDAPPAEKPAAPIEEPKKQEKVQPESVQKEVKKPEDSKKIEKPVENEKPLLTPDQVEKLDPNGKGAWGAIKNANKRAHSMIEQKDSEINKLKATLAEKSSNAQKELEELKAKMTDLEKYRAMIDIQADPEFVSKYDQPLEKAREGVKNMLLKLNVSPETIAGLDFKNTELLDQVVGLVGQKDRFTASKLERMFKEFIDLSDKRDETLQEHQKNYKETLEARKKESVAKQFEGEGRMIKHIEAKAGEKDKDGKPIIPFLSKMEPKENATQAEIDQVNNHNSLVEAMGKKLETVLKMKEPEQQAEVAIAAVTSHWLAARLRATEERLRNAEAELQKISTVSSEAPARKANNPGGRNGHSEPLNTDQALESYFAKGR